MKKIYFILTAIFGILLSSCTNDDIPVQNTTTISVNLSTVIKNFTYQFNIGDLDGVSSEQKLRVRLFVYDSNGNLYTKDETSVRNYLTNTKFEVNLNANEPYTAIVISDVTTDKAGDVPEYWSVSDEGSISSLKVNYLGEDSNYGIQEVLGIVSSTIYSGDDTTVNVEAAGSLVCTFTENIHAYSNVSEILIWGSRGNGFYSFDNSGNFKENPELEILPDFSDIEVSKTTYSGIYTYKFIMPQTNFEMKVGFFDSDGQKLAQSSKTALTLQKNKEYLFHVILDPNEKGDGTYSLSFSDVSNKTYGGSGSLESSKEISNDFQRNDNTSINSKKRVFKIEELI